MNIFRFGDSEIHFVYNLLYTKFTKLIYLNPLASPILIWYRIIAYNFKMEEQHREEVLNIK